MTGGQRSPSIGLVVPGFDKGGLEQVVFNLYKGYKAAGYRCIILSETNTSGQMSARLDEPGDFFIFNCDETLFLKACRRRGLTHLHYHYSTFGLAGATAIGLRTLYTIHNVYTWLEDDAFIARSHQIMSASCVVAVSRLVRDYFCKRAGIDFEDVLVIPNGVDVDHLLAGAGSSQSNDGGRFVFANIASTHRNKHHAVAIGAAERLLPLRSDFVVILLGNVGDPAYDQEIATKIAASSARDHIVRQAYISPDRIGSFYRDVVDCVLLPSLQEGCSNVVLESLAAGKPMILTAVGNAEEASALSDRVIVIPPAYSDIQKLRPGIIDELSRSSETRNVDALAGAMLSMMEAGYDPLDAEQLKSLHAQISVGKMVDAYLRCLRLAGELNDDVDERLEEPEPSTSSIASGA